MIKGKNSSRVSFHIPFRRFSSKKTRALSKSKGVRSELNEKKVNKHTIKFTRERARGDYLVFLST